LSEDECMKETRKLSGMKLGGGEGGATNAALDNNPREMAARKALERFERQQKQQQQQQQQQQQLDTNSDAEMLNACSCGACGEDEVTCQPC